jgi:hypothetical protein
MEQQSDMGFQIKFAEFMLLAGRGKENLDRKALYERAEVLRLQCRLRAEERPVKGDIPPDLLLCARRDKRGKRPHFARRGREPRPAPGTIRRSMQSPLRTDGLSSFWDFVTDACI